MTNASTTGTEPALRGGASSSSADTTADPGDEKRNALYARGDFRAMRALPQQGASDTQRAALRVDPVHALVLAACALVLLAIALHYAGGSP
jgi:hypothetical protein